MDYQAQEKAHVGVDQPNLHINKAQEEDMEGKKEEQKQKIKKKMATALRRAIYKNQPEKVQQILACNHRLLETQAEECFLRACLNQRYEVVGAIVAMSQYASKKTIFYLCLIECIRHSELKMVQTLIEQGCDPNIIFPQKGLSLSTIDYAILGGHYSIAFYLYPKMNPSNKKLRNPQEYLKIASKMKYRFVNYQLLLDSLQKSTIPKQAPNILSKTTTFQARTFTIPKSGPITCWQRLVSFFCLEIQGQQEEIQVTNKTNSTNDEEKQSQTNRPIHK